MENNKFQPAFVWTGNPATVNEQTPHLPGQLGCKIEVGNKKWQYVQLDTGCVAANTVGVVAANDLAFWKDRTAYLVTNDIRQSESKSNSCCGVFGVAVTAGYYCFVQTGGRATVAQGSGTAAAGSLASAYASGTAADALFTNESTYPINLVIGRALGADSSGVAIELLIDPID